MKLKIGAIVTLMNDSAIDWKMLITETRARVYLLWAIIVGIGYTTTHYYQNPNINIVWTALSVVGFGYMFRVMPLKVRQMRNIFLAWLVPITLGIALSVIAVRTTLLPDLVSYLGGFWLLVSAVGYAWNGIVDPPSKWYFIASGANVAFGVICLTVPEVTQVQYLVAALVSVWSMLSLWLFRPGV